MGALQSYLLELKPGQHGTTQPIPFPSIVPAGIETSDGSWGAGKGMPLQSYLLELKLLYPVGVTGWAGTSIVTAGIENHKRAEHKSGV